MLKHFLVTVMPRTAPEKVDEQTLPSPFVVDEKHLTSVISERVDSDHYVMVASIDCLLG